MGPDPATRSRGASPHLSRGMAFRIRHCARSFTPSWRTSSSPGEFHPQALTEPDGKLALHPALHTRHWRNGPAFRSAGRFLPFRVDLSTQRSGSWLRLGGKFLPLAELTRQRNGVRGPLRSMPITGTSPLLQAHPPLCLASVVSASGVHPLRLFPSHQGHRFPGSLSEPRSESRHLNAGRHAGSKRISPAFIPGQRLDPGFDVVPTLSTLHRWFTCVRLSDPHLTRSRHAFSLTLTTGAFDPSRSRWFAACLRRPAARGLPSSRTDIAWRTIVRITLEGDARPARRGLTTSSHQTSST